MFHALRRREPRARRRREADPGLLLHSRRFYVNMVLAPPLCSSARAPRPAIAARRRCKPTLLTLRGTLQRVRDVAVAVELVELATVLLYATLLTTRPRAGRRGGTLRRQEPRPDDYSHHFIVSSPRRGLRESPVRERRHERGRSAAYDKQTKPSQFLDESNVDDDTQLRVRAHFDYLMVKQGGLAGDRILARRPGIPWSAASGTSVYY